MCTVLLPPGVNPVAVNKCNKFGINKRRKISWPAERLTASNEGRFCGITESCFQARCERFISEREAVALWWNVFGTADCNCSNSWNCVQRELHQREIRSDVTGNFMQNDNRHGRPVGTVSYNEVAEGTTMDDANDAHSLLFMYTDVFFPSALWHVYQPKSLAGSKIIIKNTSLEKWLEEYKGIQGGVLDGSASVLEGDMGGSIHGVSFPATFIIYNTGLKRKFLYIYSDINNDNYNNS
jgi:hypothetical protein